MCPTQIPEKSTSPTLSGGNRDTETQASGTGWMASPGTQGLLIQSPVIRTGDKAWNLRYQIASPVEVKKAQCSTSLEPPK